MDTNKEKNSAGRLEADALRAMNLHGAFTANGRYSVSSTNRKVSQHRRLANAQTEAINRIADGDREVIIELCETVYRPDGVYMGRRGKALSYEYKRVYSQHETPASAVAVSDDQQWADALRACTGSVQVTYNDAVSPAPHKPQTARQAELAHMRAVDSFSDHTRISKERATDNGPADRYNRAVWTSAAMAEAQRRVKDAGVDLTMEGWGKLTLDNARAHLVRAIELVDAMLALEVK